jgi:AcrR family transcriptional regulator
MGNPVSRTKQKAETRHRILEAAGRGFRKGGYGGVGVDSLAKEAGVTSGAFYVHFKSKAVAFRESVVQGMSELREGVIHFQSQSGRNWWPEFVRFYLGEKRECDLSDSCALQSLAAEVARSDDASREAFELELMKVAEIIAAGPKSVDAPANVAEAWTALATLIGGVTLARAVSDKEMAGKIAQATERVLLPHQSKSKASGKAAAKPKA